MKIVGTISSSNTYIFCISTNNTHLVRFDVYSRFKESSEIELFPTQLNTVKVAAYNEYLIASAMVNKSGAINKYTGNLGVVNSVIKQLSETETLADMLAGSVDVGVYTFSACTVEIISINAFITSVKQIEKTEYSQVKLHAKNRDFVEGTNRHKLKTFEEVISSRDMSWYYDEMGRCKKEYVLVQSLDELAELMQDAVKYEYMSFDTETTGTSFYWYKGDSSKRSKICGMSLSWRRDQGIYIPFMSKVFKYFDLAEVMKIVYPVMRTRKIVCHNGIFDFKVLYSYGYYIPIEEDTLLMAFNIDARVKSGSKGLKTLTRKYLNHETLELDELTGGTVIPELIPYIDAELIKVYACADSDYTLQLFDVLRPAVEGMPCYRLDIKLIDILAIAEYQGAPINMQLLQTMSDINNENMKRVEHLMEQYVYVVGLQSLAAKAIRETKAEGYEPTSEEIKLLCEYPPFLDSVKYLFTKEAVTHKEKERGKPLQFSASADVAYIMYDLLGYPVLKTNSSGSRTSDKEAVNRLLEYTATNRVEFLKDDLYTSAPNFGIDSKEVIISKSAFEGYKYPFAYLLQTWRKLQKFSSSFFGPLLAESSSGYYNTDNSMTSAETGRVINKIQTLEGSLKELVVPRSDEWYMIVFDKSQIEFRVMLGLASTYWNNLIKSGKLPIDVQTLAEEKNLDVLVERLNDWEKDYHREGGAIFAGCTPDAMTNKQRKKVKAIHFSVPYGANAASVAKPKLAGHPESEWDAIIAETEGDLAAWRNKLYPLYYYLEHVRDVALTPLKTNPMGVSGTVGMVRNPMGRYRLFDLSDTSYKACASIRRQAGNFPIQSLARDIFFSGVLKLFNRLKEEGIITEDFNTSKALLNIFVHDEVVLQVHKSIHPYRMYKYIMETNLTRLSGHPTYFMGIAVADTWGKGKTDSYEAPIDYVKECVHKYERNKDYYDNIESTVDSLSELDYTKLCWEGITDWFAKRACKELSTVLAGSSIIDPRVVHDKLINYYVKPRLPFYTKPCRKEAYRVDPSLPPDTKDSKYNSYIKLFDYYLLRTGEYKNYSLLFDGKIIPYADVLDLDVDKPHAESDFDLLSDMDFDGLDMFSEKDEDYNEKEALYAEEAYLVDDPDLADSVLNSRIAPVVSVTTDSPALPSMFCEDTDGSLVFFTDSLTKQQFVLLTNYLKKFICKSGQKLYFFNGGHKVFSGVSISVGFSNREIYDVVFREKSQVTSYFGG